MRIGVAGWSIPRDVSDRFAGEDSHLARYARVFDAVEINSSFHRPHRASTYARWAASVGPEFRFAVKLPKTVTHAQRLIDCAGPLRRFAGEVGALEDRRGPVLIQLPPSLAFDPQVAERFLDELMAALRPPFVCEPRHASWFAAGADALLAERGVARVAADPPPVPDASVPGGARDHAYVRLHGSPVIYRSPYTPDQLAAHAAAIDALALAGVASWTIFDNTASGAAMGNALELKAAVAAFTEPPQRQGQTLASNDPPPA
ncbi:MAG TPA: DUF72 domain-containing protein [Sphingomonas sp.]